MSLLGQEGIVYDREHCSDNHASFYECFKMDSVLSLKSPKGFFPSTLHNLGRQATFPLRMKEKHWFIAGAATIVTLSFIHFDSDIDSRFKTVEDKNPFIKKVSPKVTDLGDVSGYVLLGGFAGYSILFHNYRAFRTSLLAAEAAIAAGIWIRIGKTLSGRMRPGQTYGDPEYKMDHWFGPFAQFQTKYNSNRGIGAFDAFPSGHTGAAFAIATVFADQYKDYSAVPITAYSLAGIVGVTRLVEHQHWASDVFLGALIGYLCGKQVVSNEKRLFGENAFSRRKVKNKSTLLPANQGNIMGLKWNFAF